MLIALLGLSLFIMNMEEKDLTTWGDVRIMLGGKEIKGITNLSYKQDVRRVSVPKITEYTGTITLTKKEANRIMRALYRSKKKRIPRKLKKKLKKEHEKRKLRRLEFWLHFLTNSYKPQIQIDRLDVNKIIADLSKEVSKLVVSPVPTLPRDPGNRPNFISYDDLE